MTIMNMTVFYGKSNILHRAVLLIRIKKNFPLKTSLL